MSNNDSLTANVDHDSSAGRSMVIGVAVCLLMLGVVFRAVAAGDFLWLDEQHTAWVAKANLADVAGRAADGNQTPLFFYACWSALKVGGESALSLRLPSLICGLCLMVIVPLWVWRHTASAASLLIVAAWFLFDYDAVFYASEARPYAMVQLLGSGASDRVLRLDIAVVQLRQWPRIQLARRCRDRCFVGANFLYASDGDVADVCRNCVRAGVDRGAS